MQSNYNRLSIAVRLALSVGIASTAAMAQAQDASGKDASTTQAQGPQSSQNQGTTAQPKQSNAKTLTAVSVTGSLIRRVDAETASPVVTLDRGAITNNGSPTLGNLLQSLPSFSGNATNSQNNSNGGGNASPTLEGGDGAARVSLRGLGTDRTLVLVDGQRLANADVNMIPQNMIERVDVLATGASTVYGSDAVGGVVNFILRKDYTGAELTVNDGISSHGDGQRHGAQFTVGASGDQGNIVGGIDYNKQDPVVATRRSFSAYQLSLYSSGPQISGSHTIPTGRMQVPGGLYPNCPANSQGITNVTLANGNGNSLGNYRCFNGASDVYNYNAYNYIQTQSERTNLFVLGNYKFNDYVTFFADAFYNHTNSSGQDAPAPTSVSDGWSVAANNPNNPFGVPFGNPNNGGNFMSTRLTGLGSRLHTYTTTNEQINTGLRGNFGNDSSWIWDASIDYGHSHRVQTDYNEVNVPAFQATIDSGANIFDQADPSVSAQLRKGVDAPIYTLTNTMKQLQANASGEIFDMPAGAAQLSVGALYRKNTMNYNVTSDAILDPTTGTCTVLQEACGSPASGSQNVKELYAESLIPLLSEVPGAYSLNVDVGLRYSNYSTSGSTTNGKFAVEYRPITDLLVRGTVSQVFRAPNLDELYDGRTITNPTIVDPCVNLSAAELAGHGNACQYVLPNTNNNLSQQITAYYSGAASVGSSLKPEKGKSYDLGFVYSPSWLEGASTTVDLWRITLKDMLTAIQAQTVLNECYANDSSPYCSYINRYNSASTLAGGINFVNTPYVNLGNLNTSGVDFSINYAIPHFDVAGVDPGHFKTSLQTTYTGNYKNDATPGQPGAETINYAGTYTQQFGNITRWRATFTANWNLGNWSAQWQMRYIDHLSNLTAYADTGAAVSTPMGAVTYHNIQGGYEWAKYHTRFDLGIDNLSNKIPPLVYQNGVNYNVDTATYDTLGRYFWARVTVKF